MPTYEYTCKNCGQTIEAFQSFSDKPLRKHKECGGGELQKVFHARGVVFKGSGFYTTDSRSKGGATEGKSAKKSEPSKKSEPTPAGAAGSSPAPSTGATQAD
jgi:putative FmdB family regulatory protein